MRYGFTFAATRVLLIGTLAGVISTQQAWGWGREGHRLTALVAEAYLTPEAKAQVAALLLADAKHPQTMADVASWADEYRSTHGETAPWHFVDIPASAETFDRQRDCPASTPPSPWRDCVTDRILYFEGRLGDAELRPEERAVALKFLIHLIGDVHQPLHAIGDDRGGNNTHVSFLGSQQCGTGPCNLHGIWDDGLIEEHHLSEGSYVDLLKQEIALNHWERLAGGAPSVWANLSHKYAVQAGVPNGTMLPRAYYDEEIKVVDSQLALGGLRLAHVLNNLLAAPASAQQQ